jgi:hypothetical protein
MFSWYWLADLCKNGDITFTLGHALYMRAIHRGKAERSTAARRRTIASCQATIILPHQRQL